MKDNSVKVSVFCLAYNHEKYIRKCLEGFIKQKTTFDFEVLVHDDASTDNTVKIIREFELKYPNIIKPIYQTENQYSKGIKMFPTLLPKAKGKYVALCEGDDYWISEYKLQKQYEALETHLDCYMCLNRVQLLYETGEFRKGQFPNFHIETGVLKPEYVLDDYNFQTCSFFVRRDYYFEYFNAKLPYKQVCKVGDFPTQLYFCDVGNIYYIDEVLSCYRTGSIGSYNFNLDKEKRLKNLENIIETAEVFDRFTNYKYHAVLAHRIKREKFLIAVTKKDIRRILSRENREFVISKKGTVLKTFFPKLMRVYHEIKMR